MKDAEAFILIKQMISYFKGKDKYNQEKLKQLREWSNKLVKKK